MNKQLFQELLQSPKAYEQVSIQSLKDLSNDFPFSALVKSVYLKKLYLEEDYRFENELFKTAMLVPDRAALKRFLFDQQPLVLQPSSAKEKPLTQLRIIEDDSKVVDSAPDPKAIEKDNTVQKVVPELENELIAQAINASISIEVKEEQHTKEEAEKQKVSGPPFDQQEDQSAILDGKQTFSQWVNTFQFKNQSKLIEKENFRKNAEALIDQFIKSQPKIVAKKEFYTAENRAKKSVEETGDIASETLANIYAAQGKLQKAIQTYERLILRFPEKKAYFAGQISQLKNNS